MLLLEKSCHPLHLLRLNVLPFFMALLQTCTHVHVCVCECETIHSLCEIILTRNRKLLNAYKVRGFQFFTQEECEDATF